MRGICMFWTLALCIAEVRGHGRLLEPPSRASMWRLGFDSPKNYNDNQLFCGGFYRQWSLNGGKCGVCGDPWNGPREHEAGGKYATGKITRSYTEGATIDIEIQVTASHHGFFEFRLCPNNDPTKAVTQECLDRYLLHQQDGKTRVIEVGRAQMYRTQLVLPDGVTCSQCLLQWKWNTGNSYGCDKRRCCKGCGPQEQFYGCSDISIAAKSSQSSSENTDESQNESALTNGGLGEISGGQAHQSNPHYSGQIAPNQFVGGHQHNPSSLQAIHGFLPINVAHSQLHRPNGQVASHHMQQSNSGPVSQGQSSIPQQSNPGPVSQGQASIPQLPQGGQSHFVPIHQGPALTPIQGSAHKPQHLVHGFLPINVGVQHVNGHLPGSPVQHVPSQDHHLNTGHQLTSQSGPSHGSLLSMLGYVPHNVGTDFLPHHQAPQHATAEQHHIDNQHASTSEHGSVLAQQSAAGHMSLQAVHGFLPINVMHGSHTIQSHQASSAGSGSDPQPCRATPQYRAAYPMADQYCLAKCRQGQCPPTQYCLDSCRH
ncbi:uncharacterized protein LOC110452715 [Mizuhopecten yessoensis]|uniref:Chitin-binding type-4 domain-containing protein n=1 Tax=Mizuhopecten yessoensis TaxID=6573 RepID=A0A210R786_MIZYE|nr:uncharacterized protein LOC110452715 [Mizuhopecten yessoensis]OWF56794.1 hypothetical protein KP79_PYT16055 [Mizuhopecten yessoensis]